MASNGLNSNSLERKSGFFSRTASWINQRSSTLSLSSAGKHKSTESTGSAEAQEAKRASVHSHTENGKSESRHGSLRISFRKKPSNGSNGSQPRNSSDSSRRPASETSATVDDVKYFPMRPDTEFNEKFQVIEKLANGAFGDVLKVTKRDDNRCYVVKIMNKQNIMQKGGWNMADQVKLEAAIHRAVSSHVFVVRCFESWQTSSSLFHVLEFASNGDLFSFWKKTGAVSLPLTRIIVAQLAMAMEFLHNSSVIYRDLKFENVLIEATGYLRICDFGLAKWLRAGQRTRTICGTLLYMAPELLSLEPYGHAADWWSLGICTYALLAGFFPAYGATSHQEMLRLVNVCCFEPPDNVSPDCRELIECLLARDPAERAHTVMDLQRCEFFRGFSFQSVFSQRLPVISLCNEQEARILFGPQARPQPQPLIINGPAMNRPVNAAQPGVHGGQAPNQLNGPPTPRSPASFNSSAPAIPGSQTLPNARSGQLQTKPGPGPMPGPGPAWNPNQSEASLNSSQSFAQGSRDTLNQSQSLPRSPNVRLGFAPQSNRAPPGGPDPHAIQADSVDNSVLHQPNSPAPVSGPSWRRSEPPMGRPDSLHVPLNNGPRSAPSDETLNRVEKSSEATTSNNSSPIRPHPAGAVRVLPAHNNNALTRVDEATASGPVQVQMSTSVPGGRQIGRIAMRAQARNAAATVANNAPANPLNSSVVSSQKGDSTPNPALAPAQAQNNVPLTKINAPINGTNARVSAPVNTTINNGPAFHPQSAIQPQLQPQQPLTPGSAARVNAAAVGVGAGPGPGTLPLSSRPMRSNNAPQPQSRPLLNAQNKPLGEPSRPIMPQSNNKSLAFAVSGSPRMRHIERPAAAAGASTLPLRSPNASLGGMQNQLDLSDRMLELHRVAARAYNDLQNGKVLPAAAPSNVAGVRNNAANRSPTATATTSSNNEHSEHEFDSNASEQPEEIEEEEAEEEEAEQEFEEEEAEEEAEGEEEANEEEEVEVEEEEENEESESQRNTLTNEPEQEVLPQKPVQKVEPLRVGGLMGAQAETPHAYWPSQVDSKVDPSPRSSRLEQQFAAPIQNAPPPPSNIMHLLRSEPASLLGTTPDPVIATAPVLSTTVAPTSANSADPAVGVERRRRTRYPPANQPVEVTAPSNPTPTNIVENVPAPIVAIPTAAALPTVQPDENAQTETGKKPRRRRRPLVTDSAAETPTNTTVVEPPIQVTQHGLTQSAPASSSQIPNDDNAEATQPPVTPSTDHTRAAEPRISVPLASFDEDAANDSSVAMEPSQPTTSSGKSRRRRPKEAAEPQPAELDDASVVEYANESARNQDHQAALPALEPPKETNLDYEPVFVDTVETKPKKKKKTKAAAKLSFSNDFADNGADTSLPAVAVEPMVDQLANQSQASESGVVKKPRRSKKQKQNDAAAALVDEPTAMSEQNMLTPEEPQPAVETPVVQVDTEPVKKPRRVKKKKQDAAQPDVEPDVQSVAEVQPEPEAFAQPQVTADFEANIPADVESTKKPKRVKKKKQDVSQPDLNITQPATPEPPAVEPEPEPEPQAFAQPADTTEKPKRVKKKKQQDVAPPEIEVPVQLAVDTSASLAPEGQPEHQVAADLDANPVNADPTKKPRKTKKKLLEAAAGVAALNTSVDASVELRPPVVDLVTTPKSEARVQFAEPELNRPAESDNGKNKKSKKNKKAENSHQPNVAPDDVRPGSSNQLCTDVQQDNQLKSGAAKPTASETPAASEAQPAHSESTVPKPMDAKSKKEAEKAMKKEAEKARKEREKLEAMEKLKEKERLKAEKEKAKAEKKNQKEKPGSGDKRRLSTGSVGQLEVAPAAEPSNAAVESNPAPAAAPRSEWAVSSTGLPRFEAPQSGIAPPSFNAQAQFGGGMNFGYNSQPSPSSGGWLGAAPPYYPKSNDHNAGQEIKESTL